GGRCWWRFRGGRRRCRSLGRWSWCWWRFRRRGRCFGLRCFCRCGCRLYGLRRRRSRRGRCCRLRQRHGGVALRPQEGDHVGARGDIRKAGEGHGRAGGKGLRIGQPQVEMLEGPIALALLALERRRVVEAIERSDLAPDDAIEVRTDRARCALVEAVANLAESNVAFALFG